MSQQLAERLVIFNDTVVNDGEPTCATSVGVGIDIIGRPMGGPPCMPNPNRTLRKVVTNVLLEIGDFSLLFSILTPHCFLASPLPHYHNLDIPGV